MSTGYSWEGIRQVRATLLGARHVPERLCGGRIHLRCYIKCSTFTFYCYCVCALSCGIKPFTYLLIFQLQWTTSHCSMHYLVSIITNDIKWPIIVYNWMTQTLTVSVD